MQHAGGAGASVAGGVVAGARADNAAAARRGELGSVGMVVGATVGDAVQRLGLDLAAANAPLLAPGVGAQGGTAEDLRRVFGAALPNVLAEHQPGGPRRPGRASPPCGNGPRGRRRACAS